jgi:transposase InsO family protein
VPDLERGVERWVKHYNTWRPHEALENKTPSEVYRPKRETTIKTQEMKQAA